MSNYSNTADKEKGSEALRVVAAQLLEAVTTEETTLGNLETCIARQRHALLGRGIDELNIAVNESSLSLAKLQSLRDTRTRKAILLGSLIGLQSGESSVGRVAAGLLNTGHEDIGMQIINAREAVLRRGASVSEKCGELEFALKLAASLGRDVLLTLQELETPEQAHVYTAAGARSTNALHRNLVNQVG